MGNSMRKLQRPRHIENGPARKQQQQQQQKQRGAVRAIPFAEPSSRDYLFLSSQAGLSVAEVKDLLDTFVETHPDGRMSQKEFCEYYSILVFQPAEETSRLAERVFKILSTNQAVSLNEFFLVLALMSKSDMNTKLEYTYSLYDSAHLGAIGVQEAHEIVNGIFELLMANNEAYKGQNVARLAKNCWSHLKTTRFVTRENFIEGLANNKHIRRLLTGS